MGFRIKQIREKRNMTQLELSEKSGISRVTIWKLENGFDKSTTTKTLSRLAKALNATLDEIFYPDDD